jgi:hypothetical protein
MQKYSTLSTIISSEVKEAAVAYCRKRGLKIRCFIEEALLEQLEDEIDIEAYRERRDEELVPLATVLKGSVLKGSGPKRRKR